jgi:hypothetical protein
MRDPISLATNFPRFAAIGNDLCWHGDPMQTRWFDMQFLAEAIDKRTLWPQHSKYVLGTKDLESRAKVVKFSVIQRHEKQGAAQEHELASFEAMMLPHMDAAHNLARWLLRNEEDAKMWSRKRICVRSNRSVGSMVPMGGRGC